MIITKINAGIGNQLFKYAAGLRLAHKHNTELKLDIAPYLLERTTWPFYALDQFNISATAATPEEIEYLKNSFVGEEQNSIDCIFMPEVLDYPDNVYLDGYWENERYFADIADIIRREFTLKVPFGAKAQHWQKKILSAECSVSMHFRHGDFLLFDNDLYALLPLDYYHTCIDILKREYKNMTAFVFSDDIQWCKANLRLDLPTEYVSGGGDGTTDVEELHLMSLCKHNIIANSTFSWWGAWLNQNPDKKVFVPILSSIVGTNKTYRHFSAERNENSPLQTDRWIKVPFDLNNQLELSNRPHFSLLLVVNNNRDTLSETLDSLLAQDYKYYEVIIIENASFDGSRKICQQAAKSSDKVTLIKLCDKVSDGAAWNLALSIAQGNFAMFLKGNDRIFPDTLASMHMTDKDIVEDIVYSYIWFREDEQGTFSAEGKNFALEKDNILQDLKESADISTVKLNAPLATKVFKRKFLLDKEIRFDETAAEDAERKFTLKAMSRTDNEIFFVSNIFYIAPKI